MTLEQRLRRVPVWAWVVLGLVVLMLACCMGAGIGAASTDDRVQAPATVETSTTPPVVVTPTTVAPTSTDPCIDREHCVSPENLDAAWPLTVPWAELNCMWRYTPGQDPRAMVWVEAPDGTSYAANGTAQQFLQMPKIDSIWADSDAIPGTKVNITPLISAGMLLCK